jgi:mannose-1-phosphate guanylyltransferase / phosphomannomutase
VRRHRERAAWVTLGVKRVEEPSRYGVVEWDRSGRVLRFQEKPAPGTAFSSLVNTGIYCVDPRVLACIREVIWRAENLCPPARRVLAPGAACGRAASDSSGRSQECDWGRDVFPRLLAEGRPLIAEELAGYWRDIGTLADYAGGQRDALEGLVRVELPGVRLVPGVWLGSNASIAPGAVLKGPVLVGARCRIERDAQVLPGTVLGEGTLVRAGACLKGATLGPRCQVGPRAVVWHSVLDEDVRIGADCSVTAGAVMGRGCRLTCGMHVAAGQWERRAEHPVGSSHGLPGSTPVPRPWSRRQPAPVGC